MRPGVLTGSDTPGPSARSLPAACASLLQFTQEALPFPRTGLALPKPACFTSKGGSGGFSINQQRPLAENPAVAVGMALRSRLTGVRAPGGALGANQLRPSGSHQRHVPSGPWRAELEAQGCQAHLAVPPGGLWRRAGALSGTEEAALRDHVLPRVGGSPGGRQSLLGRSRPVSPSTLQAPTGRGLSQDRPGQWPPMPFLGRRREGGGCSRAAVQVTSDPSSPPAPAGPSHQHALPPPPAPGHCREEGLQPWQGSALSVSQPLWAVLPRKLLSHSLHRSSEGRGWSCPLCSKETA